MGEDTPFGVALLHQRERFDREVAEDVPGTA
jgi:hypothetical protein